MLESGVVVASAIEPLLRARTIKRCPGSAAKTDFPLALCCRLPCEEREQGHTDVAVVELHSLSLTARRQVRAQAEAASVVMVLATSSARRSERLRPSLNDLIIGPHGFVCTAAFDLGDAQLDLRMTPHSARQDSPSPRSHVALIAQDPAIARALGAELVARDLAPALCVGLDIASPQAWLNWLRATARSDGIDITLLALQASPRVDWLAAVDVGPPLAVVSLHGEQADAVAPREALIAPPTTAQVARALGWLPTGSIQHALETVHLLAHGLKTGTTTGHVLPCGESIACQQLAARALDRCGLSPQPTTRDSPVVAVVSAGRLEKSSPDKVPHFTLTPHRASPTSWPADQTTLEALRDVLAWRRDETAARAPQPTKRATRGGPLMTGVPLTEVDIKTLLSSFELHSPAEQLTTSATAAAAAARACGLPAAVKVVGSGLRDRRRWGGVELQVESVGGVRQAFRNVVHAAREHFPNSELAGVLVSQQIDTPLLFDCRLQLFSELQLLQLRLRTREIEIEQSISERCPLAADSAHQLARMLTERAARYLMRPPPHADIHALARLLSGLSRAAVGLASAFTQIHLDAISWPTAGGEALLLDARAARRAHPAGA